MTVSRLPPLWHLLVGAVVWAAIMAASAAFGLRHWETPAHVGDVVLLYAMGGGLAFPLGLSAAHLLARSRRRETAFAAAFLALTTATVAVTGGLFALDYRAYYAAWHAHPFSLIWTLQLVFTILAALYQFAVLGIRLLFPLGFIALVAASLWFARRAR